VRGDFAWIPVAIIGARELFISVYRAMAARRGITMPARMLGKWKANVQFLAVALALFQPTAGTAWVADTALWVAVAMTVISGIDLVANSTRSPAVPPSPSPSPVES
jgi:CDP-diacylglycerol--glycerol-3-phosphate 3-phosphatidyltransferase